MAVALRYFTDFGKPAFQHIRVSICGKSIVFCSGCTMSSVKKYTFAISSPDEFLMSQCTHIQTDRYRQQELFSNIVRSVLKMGILCK